MTRLQTEAVLRAEMSPTRPSNALSGVDLSKCVIFPATSEIPATASAAARTALISASTGLRSFSIEPLIGKRSRSHVYLLPCSEAKSAAKSSSSITQHIEVRLIPCCEKSKPPKQPSRPSKWSISPFG
jgi:hypothetical protein